MNNLSIHIRALMDNLKVNTKKFTSTKITFSHIIHYASPSHICHAVGPLVDPFQSHVSRSLFKGLP